MQNIFKVIKQTETIAIHKQDGTSVNKSTIVLQEYGSPYADSYVCTLMGNAATCRFYQTDVVFASLRFTHHEHNATCYQDVMVEDIFKLG